MTGERPTPFAAPAFYLACLATAFSATDRVDVAAGLLPFGITPFLILAPAYIFCAILDLVGTGRFPRSILFASRWLALGGFVILAGLTVLAAPNDYLELGPQRYALFVLLVSFSVVWCIQCSLRGTLARVLRVGAGLGIALYLLACLGQILALLVPAISPVIQPGERAFLDLTPFVLGGTRFLRLSGPVEDPNRGAVSIAVFSILYFLLSERRRPPYWALTLGGVLVLLSWSRTGLIFYATALAIIVARRPRTFAILVGTVAILFGLVSPALPALNRELDFLMLFQRRTSLEEEGTVGHLLLVERALRLGFATDLRTTALGVGYGSEYSVTEEFFPRDTKYANFHSNLFSVLAQTGVFGLFLFVTYTWLQPFMIGWQGRWRGPYAAAGLALAYLLAGFFYEYTAEPLFWMVCSALNCLPSLVAALGDAPAGTSKSGG